MLHQQRYRLCPGRHLLEAGLQRFRLDRGFFTARWFVKRLIEREVVADFGFISAAFLAASLFATALDGRPRLFAATPILTSLPLTSLTSATTTAAPAAATLFAFRRLPSRFRALRFRTVLARRCRPFVEPRSEFVSLVKLCRPRRRSPSATRKPFFPIPQVAGLRLGRIQTKRGNIGRRPHVFVWLIQKSRLRLRRVQRKDRDVRRRLAPTARRFFQSAAKVVVRGGPLRTGTGTFL